MIFNEKKLYIKASAVIAGIYFLSFLIYYIANFFASNTDILLYADIFLNKLTYLSIPIASGIITFIYIAYKSIKGALIRLIALSAVRIIYFIPFNYLTYMNLGFDSADSLIFSVLFSLADAVLSYALSLAVAFIIRFTVIKRGGTDSSLPELISRKTQLDFSDPVAFSFMLLSAFSFLYFFIVEIIDTVTFIKNYGFSFTATEIFYTVFSYVFDVLVIFIYFYFFAALKNKTVEKCTTRN